MVSGKYWFSGIKPGMPVLAHCDMETEGEYIFGLVVDLRPQIARNTDHMTWFSHKTVGRLKHYHSGRGSPMVERKIASLQTTAN